MPCARLCAQACGRRAKPRLLPEFSRDPLPHATLPFTGFEVGARRGSELWVRARGSTFPCAPTQLELWVIENQLRLASAVGGLPCSQSREVGGRGRTPGVIGFTNLVSFFLPQHWLSLPLPYLSGAFP